MFALSDQIEQASQAFVFDDRRLLHLADLVEGSVWQVDAFVADDHATVGKIEDGHAFADWPIVRVSFIVEH
jgi:hypothetical protein